MILKSITRYDGYTKINSKLVEYAIERFARESSKEGRSGRKLWVENFRFAFEKWRFWLYMDIYLK